MDMSAFQKTRMPPVAAQKLSARLEYCRKLLRAHRMTTDAEDSKIAGKIRTAESNAKIRDR